MSDVAKNLIRIQRLAARCVRYGNDRRYNLDIDQKALDAWTDEEIDKVEQEMDSMGLVWDEECDGTYLRIKNAGDEANDKG